MFGGFTIAEFRNSKKVAYLDANLSGKAQRLWVLLAYLIVNHRRAYGISSQELIDMLWPEPLSDNPEATLQNNISRIRKALKDAGFSNAGNMIRYESGAYRWSPGMEASLDIDIFDELAKRFSHGVPGIRVDDAMEACAMYKGDFLGHACSASWCVNLGIAYRTVFLDLCRNTVKALVSAGRDSDAVAVCLHAVEVDPSAEEFSVTLMRLLTDTGSPRKAVEHFESAKRILQSSFGTDPSPEMEMEHERALRAIHGGLMGKREILAFLEDDSQEGAFYCSNGVFREVVHLIARDMRRSGSEAQLVTLGIPLANEGFDEHLAEMNHLKEAIESSIRSSDPFTKINSDQFLILLPGASRKDSESVINRIEVRYRAKFPGRRTKISSSSFGLVVYDA